MWFIFFASIFMSGCASIMSSSQYSVNVESSVPDATVVVKDKHGNEVKRANTPTIITLSSGGSWSPASYMFEFSKEGYSTITESMTSDVNSWYYGNIILGGLIGSLIVDPMTGAMWKLKDRVYGNLYKNDSYKENEHVPKKYHEAPVSSGTTIKSNDYTTTNSNIDSIAEQLKELKSLKESGVLTPQEYDIKRKELVGKL